MYARTSRRNYGETRRFVSLMQGLVGTRLMKGFRGLFLREVAGYLRWIEMGVVDNFKLTKRNMKTRYYEEKVS